MRSVCLLLALVAVPVGAQEIECLNGQASLPDVGSFSCQGVNLVGYLSPAAFGVPGSEQAGHNDIWGWTDTETGVEYALVGTRNGLGFVSLEDPTRPVVLGKMPTTRSASTWRDVKVYADHAFVVADGSSGHGMQVFDLTRLRGLSGAPGLLEPDAVYDLISSAHNIVINEETGFAYAVGAGRVSRRGLPDSCRPAGFHAINIQNPTNPTFASCFSDIEFETGPRRRGYTHDAQCVIYRGPDVDYQGREICFGSNEDVVTVFDVTDKDNVQVVSQAAYPTPSYTHQGWLTEDHRYMLVNDELDELSARRTQRTLVIDFDDLELPEFAFAYEPNLTTSDHNLYIKGRYAYESNYESGLRIVDLDQIENGTLTEAAFFDTFPTQTRIGFGGQWSNYPYFESGLVIANDGDFGLFVLRPTGLAEPTDSEDAPTLIGYELTAPFPNPTTTRARLSLRVGEAQAVVADLFDVAGRRVASVFEGTAATGSSLDLEVDGSSLPAGVYVLRVTGETFEASRRIVLTSR
ncbi:MAG: choice-of-anchor B family protein [Rubrivirga sp.]